MNINIKRICGALFFAALFLLIAPDTKAVVLNNKPDTDAWGTDGEVKAMVKDSDGNLYVGGAFNETVDSANMTGGYLIADKDSGAPLVTNIKTNSTVFVTKEDGGGGFYIGGMFTIINDQKRNCLAHILPDGTLDPDFHPFITGGQGSVRDIILYEGYLYVSGNFTSVDGQTRNYMLKMDADGNLDPSFTPNFNGPVFKLGLSGSNLYAAGNFTTVNGTSRKYLAKLDLSGVLDASLSLNIPSGAINYFTIFDNNIYIAGAFTAVGSTGSSTPTTHKGLAKLNFNGVVDHSFNPGFTGLISDNYTGQAYRVITDGSAMYVSGNFTTVTSSGTTTAATRNGLAKLNMAGLVDPNFTPSFDGIVWSTLLYNNSLYVSGSFFNMNSSPVNHLIKLDTDGNLITSFNLPVNQESWPFAYGSKLYVGGKFNSYVPGIKRDYLAKFKPDGTLDESFNPKITGASVMALGISGSDIYVGGNFTAVASTGTTTSITHNNLVKISTSGIVDHSFNPSFNDYINNISISGSDIYVGGAMKSVFSAGATTTVRLAKLNTAGTVDTSFNPIFNGPVMTTLISGSDIYVGGNFTTVASAGTTTALAHVRLVRLSTSGIVDQSFGPSFNNTIRAIGISGSDIYVGGLFTAATSTGAASGLTRTSLAKMNSAGILDPDFAPSFPLSIFSLIIPNNNEIYVTGNFLSVNSVTREYIAKFDTAGNLDNLFQPVMGGYGSTVFMFDNVLYVGNSHTPSPFRYSPDILAPVISLNGSPTISLDSGQTYSDAGATALDANFGDLTSSITTSNPVNTNIPNTYTVTYTVTDAAGNTGTATRLVTIRGTGSLPAGALKTPEEIIASDAAGSQAFRINDSLPFTTDNPLVTLRFDNFNNSLIDRLAVSSSPDFSASSLMRYASSLSYDLCAGKSDCLDGDYVIYAKYYTVWGQSSKPVSIIVTLKRNGQTNAGTASQPNAASSVSAVPVLSGSAAKTLSARLSGRILLQAESHGEAWYVNPVDGLRYYLGRPADAFNLMRRLGLGASHKFISGYKVYPARVSGKILIDVDDVGKAYYIYPKDRKAYYLGRPEDAFNLMRKLGLGIADSDLDRIGSGR